MAPTAANRESSGAAGAWIVAAVILVYANSFFAPFIFDDGPAIEYNPTIRNILSLDVLHPPANGSAVQNRPLVNLSLAVNFAAGGLNPWGYHLFNVLLHAASALLLFGLIRRTFMQPALAPRFAASAPALAFAATALWAVHPLQTETVTCVVQRTEGLMAFFYLLTLYAFVRSTAPGSTPGNRWQQLSVLACLLGVLSKETMVTAPLVVVLYDRTFVAGTFREAWRQRRIFHASLAATWLVLALLVLRSGAQRGDATGFGLGAGHHVTWWTYPATQCWAIVHYLRLAFWPSPLVLDYGSMVVRDATAILPQALLLLALLAATFRSLGRGAALGFAGAWFFLVLAPTSSVLPAWAQTVAEHRMYLPLAAVIIAAVCALHAVFGHRSHLIFAVIGVALGWLTIQRNQLYRDPVAIMEANVLDVRDNPRAHLYLAQLLASDPSRRARAIAEYETALRLDTRVPGIAHNELGLLFVRDKRLAEAREQFAAACAFDPASFEAHNNLGRILVELGDFEQAVAPLDKAVALQPASARTHNSLGIALLNCERVPAAIAEFRRAIQLEPDFARAHCNLGAALSRAGQIDDAKTELTAALQLDPSLEEAKELLDRFAAARRR